MRRKSRNKKLAGRTRRHMHIRRRVAGTPDRPRACVFRSNSHIYAQIIDDETGKTIASASSLTVDASGVKADDKKGIAGNAKVLTARAVGKQLASMAKEKGVSKIAFDRGGYLYHGRVAALADGLREGGLEF